jgi:serine/threonine-protein kinase
MRLAWLYRSEKAEVAAAHAAEMARVAAAHASNKVKLLAQFCYDMNARGDYVLAVETIREYVAQYPRDVDGMKGLARVLWLQGYLPESLLAAQQGYHEDPFDAETYAEAEVAMMGMDRFESALQLAAQARRLGVVRSGNALIAGYLAGMDDVVEQQVSAAWAGVAEEKAGDGAQITYAELIDYGLYLDDTGRIGAGLDVWRRAAAKAGKVPGLASTQAYLLAQGALDRALAESCTISLEMVNEVRRLPKGPVASFNAGMAAALCGDETYAEKAIAGLRQDFPQNTAVQQYYVPELQAAAALGVNEPARALQGLIALGQYDQISLTPYLRGMARAAVGQTPLAINDFQSVLSHRGVDLMIGGTLYPMAEMGVARVYAASGDKKNSAASYRRFLMMWGEADRGQPLMAAALAKSR